MVPTPDAEWVRVVTQVEQPVVIHLPWAPDRSASQFAQTTRWMIEALPHEMQLVNGYSGYFPAHHSKLRNLMADFPNEEALQALRDLEVDFIVLHGPIDPTQRSRIDQLIEAGLLTGQATLADVSVIRIPSGD